MPNIKIAGTIRSDIGLERGIRLLLDGESALDAVEQSIRCVEDNENDWTVGTGGMPNLLGEVQLDASIMDGATLKSGAVAAIKRHKNPISIARKVMEETPHALLVGEGADQFADIMGFTGEDLLTQAAKNTYEDLIRTQKIIPRDYDTERTQYWKERYRKSFQNLVEDADLMEWYRQYAKENHGTVNVIARDQKNNICSGVSTSGLSFAFPDRVGDSPLIGAGNYCDNRYGAACCVGVGEIAIRLSLARVAVYELSNGASVEEAATTAIQLINDLEKNVGTLSILVMDATGRTCSAANFKEFYYWIADDKHHQPIRKDAIYVKTKGEYDVDILGYHR